MKTGSSVLIGGFIVSGTGDKQIVMRALGPSLGALGVVRPLPNPSLEIYDVTGKLVAQNDNWTSLPPGTVPDGLQPSNPLESVVVTSLKPGVYTAVLRSTDGGSGNALIELYDLSPNESRVMNISTRGDVGTGDDAMIGGFIVGGTMPSTLLVRAIGPSLVAAGIPDALTDPVLELHDSQGNLVSQNDNWRSTQRKQILATGVAPTDNRESAILATLNPGSYTAVVRGVSNTSGVALVEVYALDQ